MPMARLSGARKQCLVLLVEDSAETYELYSEVLAKAGYAATVRELALLRAEQACDIGVDGLVCSPEEVAPLREAVGNKLVLVCPGIRPAGAAAGDQKRIATPSAAIDAGADYLVVGRPVIAASDPRAAAEAIVAEIAGATRKQASQGA